MLKKVFKINRNCIFLSNKVNLKMIKNCYLPKIIFRIKNFFLLKKLKGIEQKFNFYILLIVNNKRQYYMNKIEELKSQ